MKISVSSIVSIISLFFFAPALTGQNNQIDFNTNSNNFKLRAVAELGFVSVLDHTIQFSNSGTEIDYIKDGGQDNLYSFSRFSLEAEFNPKNIVTVLIQPLRIETQTLLDRDLIIDDLVYPEGTGVNFLYNFPFYRMSYMREFMSTNDKYSFAFGATIQIRNATIGFESQDGTLFRRNADVGIVPALKLRTRAKVSPRSYIEIEADGIYAPVSYLNGSDNEIIGAILDASFRVGYQLLEPVDTFFNLRYLGGGAVGTDPDFTGPGDGYVKNWLHFLTVSAGSVYKF